MGSESILSVDSVKRPTNDIFSQVAETLRDADLAEVKDTRAKQLSGGQKRKLCVALALIADPKVRHSLQIPRWDTHCRRPPRWDTHCRPQDETLIADPKVRHSLQMTPKVRHSLKTPKVRHSLQTSQWDTHCRPQGETLIAGYKMRHSLQTSRWDTHCRPQGETLIADPTVRHSLQTPRRDTHCRPQGETLIADPTVRHSLQTPTWDTHCRPQRETLIADPKVRHSLQTPTWDTHCMCSVRCTEYLCCLTYTCKLGHSLLPTPPAKQVTLFSRKIQVRQVVVCRSCCSCQLEYKWLFMMTDYIYGRTDCWNGPVLTAPSVGPTEESSSRARHPSYYSFHGWGWHTGR